jgi:hypothetical protein
MRKMPPALRAELEADPFYQRCCITGVLARYEKVDWHHNFIFAGRQVNEKWCILPLAKAAHDDIVRYKEKCDWIMLNRASDETLKKYSKATNLTARRDSLNKKYGACKIATAC